MSNKKKNFRFLSVLIFVSVFMISGMYTNLINAQVSSQNTISIDNSFSSYKTIIYSINGVSTVTTIIGCAKGSGDIYDMNTGKICTNDTSRPLLVGCVAGSGDVYNINTGKVCTNDTKTKLTSCQAGSNDIYDINTGKICPIKIAIANKMKSVVTNPSPVNILSKNSNTFPINIASSSVDKDGDLAKTEDVNNEEENISGREKIGNSVSATVEKAGSIFKSPMSIWIILLIIIILAGGGYGVYSFNTLKANKKDVEVIAVKNTETPMTPKTNPINVVNEQKNVPNNNNNSNNNPQPTPNTNTNNQNKQ